MGASLSNHHGLWVLQHVPTYSSLLVNIYHTSLCCLYVAQVIDGLIRKHFPILEEEEGDDMLAIEDQVSLLFSVFSICFLSLGMPGQLLAFAPLLCQ